MNKERRVVVEKTDDTEDRTVTQKVTEHVSASGDDETEDGLNELDEETRRGTEDIPAAERTRSDIPVFERSERSRDDG